MVKHLSKIKQIFALGISSFVLFITILSIPTNHLANNAGEDKLVYVIPIEDAVERGLEAFLIRSTN